MERNLHFLAPQASPEPARPSVTAPEPDTQMLISTPRLKGQFRFGTPGMKSRSAEPAHFGYIDALRGLAFLGVFIVHSSQNILHLPARVIRMCSFGQFGVQLFFVLSALTLLLSFHSRSQEKQTQIRSFLLRRLFRIAPLFWIGIVFYNRQGLHPNFFAPDGLTWKQVLATAVFLHGWSPSYINCVVPGGWSIAVEMTFYACFPFLAVWLSNSRRTLAALLVAIAAGSALNLAVFPHLAPFWSGNREPVLDNFLGWWFPAQLPVFLIGFLLYYKMKSSPALTSQGFAPNLVRVSGSSYRTALSCVIAAWVMIPLMMHGSSVQNAVLQKLHTTSLLSAGFGCAFALLIYGLSVVPFSLFVNRFFSVYRLD